MHKKLSGQIKLATRLFATLEQRYPDDIDLKKLHAVAAGALQIAGVESDAGQAQPLSGGVDKLVILADENGDEPIAEAEDA